MRFRAWIKSVFTTENTEPKKKKELRSATAVPPFHEGPEEAEALSLVGALCARQGMLASE